MGTRPGPVAPAAKYTPEMEMPEVDACPDCGDSERWEPTDRAGTFCETWRCSTCKRPVPEGEELEARRWLPYHLAAAGLPAVRDGWKLAG